MSIPFEEVYKYKGALMSHLRGKLSPADVEDVLQETFMQAAKGLDKYDPQKGSVYTWLLVICRGRLHMTYGKFRKRNELQCTVDLSYPITPYDECVLMESVSRLTPEMFKACSTSAERMRRLRVRRKFMREVIG